MTIAAVVDKITKLEMDKERMENKKSWSVGVKTFRSPDKMPSGGEYNMYYVLCISFKSF